MLLINEIKKAGKKGVMPNPKVKEPNQTTKTRQNVRNREGGFVR